MKQVSVVIPTYGEPTYLKRSIDSVVKQTYTNIEIIIVDDNDPETHHRKETESILSTYNDNRIKYLKHPYNKNGAAARNTALKIATGEYISFLDSDDEYLPTRIEKCLYYMSNNDHHVAGVYTGCEFRKGGSKYNCYLDVKEGNFLVDTLACRFMFCTGSNIFIRKEVIDEIQGFDESFIRHQDYEFLVRVFEKYSLKAIKEILVIKNNENINLPNVERMANVKKQYLEKFSYIIERLSEENKNYIYHSNYISLAEQCQRQGKLKKANEFYSKAKEYSPITKLEWKRRLLLPFLKFMGR